MCNKQFCYPLNYQLIWETQFCTVQHSRYAYENRLKLWQWNYFNLRHLKLLLHDLCTPKIRWNTSIKPHSNSIIDKKSRTKVKIIFRLEWLWLVSLCTMITNVIFRKINFFTKCIRNKKPEHVLNACKWSIISKMLQK